MLIQKNICKKYVEQQNKIRKELKDSYVVFVSPVPPGVSRKVGIQLEDIIALYEQAGYAIKVLNIQDLKFSVINHYNPLAYIRDECDIAFLAADLVNSLDTFGRSGKHSFYMEASILWLRAVIGYLWYEAPPEEQDINTLLEFLEADEVWEKDESYQNAVDILFEELEKKNPRHFAVKQRRLFKAIIPQSIKKYVLGYLGSRLSVFQISTVKKMMEIDELELDTYNNKKTILFVFLPDEADPLYCIFNVLYAQLKRMYWLEEIPLGKKNMGFISYRIAGKI